MTPHQTPITQALTPHARYLQYRLLPGVDPRPSIQALAAAPPAGAVIGLGQTLVSALGGSIPGLRELPASGEHGVAIPSTPAALWVWLRGNDRGVLLHSGQRLSEQLAGAFALDDATDGFMYGESRDLTGYIDGTENPQAEDALAAAIVNGVAPGINGSSFVAVQRWLHNLTGFHALGQAERDNVFGRRLADNEEFDEAPESAHVKRAAQESFEPEAFMVRRSMPWSDPRGDGLVFVAFGKSFDAFEAVLARMIGREDGITDGLFRFSRPLTGSYYWCPPVNGSALDLSALGL